MSDNTSQEGRTIAGQVANRKDETVTYEITIANCRGNLIKESKKVDAV
jgi:hypothetical protein